MSDSSVSSLSIIHSKYKRECKQLHSSYEPVLDSKNTRYEALPIEKKYEDIYNLYLIHKRAFWDIDEIDFSKDRDGYLKLTENEKHFIKYVLAFFAYSDTVVNNNIGERFINDIQILEAQMFYRFQGSIEDIHSLTYSLMIQTILSEEKEINKLQTAVKTVPVLAKKKNWAEYWTKSTHTPFHIRLVAFAIVEGIFFSASFCAIYWIKQNKGNIMPGLTQSNELIARDEGLHTKHAVALFRHLNNKPSQSLIHDIIKEAVDIEIEFITESLPCHLVGMDSEKMSEYVKYVADRLIVDLGYQKLYNEKNPFEWMENISLQNKSNFFEHRETNYQKAGDCSQFELEDDF